jgi:hypothetical protein
MSIYLASAWHPRGELPRLLALLPSLRREYAALCLSLPPDTPPQAVEGLKDIDSVRIIPTTDWSHGRHEAVQAAVAEGGRWIHYADLDRLLRWVETEAVEWRDTLSVIREYDCLVIGRTPKALGTHPRSLQTTEMLVNQVFGWLLGQPLDLSAGSKGFSRAAAEHLLATSPKGRALGTDAEWPVRLSQAGFRVGSVLVDGLGWETADRYQPAAADRSGQIEAALAYDADPENWARRVAIAAEIFQAGLQAMRDAPPTEAGQTDPHTP